MGLTLAIAAALAYSLTNGFHDAANAIATLVATRGARPGQAITLTALFNILGALLFGTAVASTIAGIVTVAPSQAVQVIGAGLLGAVAWNLLTWWRGLPSSSAQALVGGLVGAGLAVAGIDSINWGGMNGLHPEGVLGVLISLAVSPVIGLVLGFGTIWGIRLLLRRATHRVDRPIREAGWLMTAALSFSHGANDAQKGMGAIAALLVATGHLQQFSVPFWVKLSCGLTLTIGTALGGWRIVRTVGRRIVRLAPVDSLASQSGSTAVILGASLVGGPVSTTQVVASSVVGVGMQRRRMAKVRWRVVKLMGYAWLLTLPAAAALGAAIAVIWGAVQ